MSAALIVAKLYPPHRGHVRLVEAALDARPRAVVLCLGSVGDSFTPDERATAFCEDLEAAGVDVSRVDVVPGLDETPYDLGSDAVWRSHVEIFRVHSASRGVDLLVSSEAYGDELARRMGIEHLCVDPERSAVPLSASAVRADVVGRWDDLGPGTRRMLTTRVVVLGAESTGTTTVAQALSERLRARGGAWSRCVWEPEYGHELTERKQDAAEAATGVRPLAVAWEPEDFAEVLRFQSEHEDAALVAGGPVLVCDTDAFATPVWERRYVGAAARLDAAGLGHGHVYLLTHHDGVPFVQDGTRDGEHVRAQMTADFMQALVEHGKPWVLLTGSLDERVELAERVVDQVCRQRWSFSEPI